MNILAIDSSGLTASVALVNEESVLAEYSTNFKKTHSQTLLPMIDSIMKMVDMKASDLDAVAVAKGPGSFTGLRIGAGTAKGIALAQNLPIIGISTLESMAYTFCLSEELICPVMDARRQQLYYGVYESREGELTNLCPNGAGSVEKIAELINGCEKSVILTGDGLIPSLERFGELLKVPFKTAPLFENRQRAAVLGTLAQKYAARGLLSDADTFAPVYLRPSQAERVRAESMQKKGAQNG